MKPNSPHFEYTIKSLKEDFPNFRKSLHDFRRQINDPEWGESQVFDIEVSLEELVSNSFYHGATQGEVKVTLNLKGKEFIAIIEDNAPPFNPLTDAPKPPLGELHERPQGGLGIHLVKNLTDRMEYARLPHGNKITLFKSLTKKESN